MLLEQSVLFEALSLSNLPEYVDKVDLRRFGVNTSLEFTRDVLIAVCIKAKGHMQEAPINHNSAFLNVSPNVLQEILLTRPAKERRDV